MALEILTEHLRTERHYSDFAILYRGNYQGKLMELKLQHHQIPPIACPAAPASSPARR